MILIRLQRAAVLEYLRIGYDLIQKGGVREDRIVHLCKLSLVAQLFDECLVFARESENIFAAAIVTG
jgi:hypothetical protein